jgi:flagellar protein FliO/FliZ
MIRAIIIGCMLLSCPCSSFLVPVYADEIELEQQNFPQDENPLALPEEEETPPHRQVIDVRKLFFKTLMMLIGLCALVVAGGYFLKRIAGGKLRAFTTDGSIQLIERKYLSPKTSLWLVEVKGQPIIVVDSQYGVAIHSLNEKETEKNLTTV